jgi:hypothetical protein
MTAKSSEIYILSQSIVLIKLGGSLGNVQQKLKKKIVIKTQISPFLRVKFIQYSFISV